MFAWLKGLFKSKSSKPRPSQKCLRLLFSGQDLFDIDPVVLVLNETDKAYYVRVWGRLLLLNMRVDTDMWIEKNDPLIIEAFTR